MDNIADVGKMKLKYNSFLSKFRIKLEMGNGEFPERLLRIPGMRRERNNI